MAADIALIGGFTRDQRRRGLSEVTIDRRRRILWAFSTWVHGSLSDALTEDVEGWLDSRSLGVRSRYTYVSSLAAFYNWARQVHQIPDPTLDCARPRLPRLIPRPLSDADLRYGIAQADPMMRAWLCLAGYEGFRCKEIANLRREDVLEDRSPALLVVADGKGHHQAVLPLNPVVEESLRAHGLPAQGFVFTMQCGRPYLPGTVSTYISRYLHGLGIEGSAHRARHSYGTAVWAASKDLLVTQQMLRHADPKTTAGYAAFDQELAVQVIRSLGVPLAPGCCHP